MSCWSPGTTRTRLSPARRASETVSLMTREGAEGIAISSSSTP